MSDGMDRATSGRGEASVAAQTWCEGCGPHEAVMCSECGYPVEAGVLIDDEMIERTARALYAEHLKTTTFFRDFEEMRESFEPEARAVLRAALEVPDGR